MMVQLKLQLAPDDSNHRLFQFHDGTIKTVFSICLEIHFIYFNSMMVQLKLTDEDFGSKFTIISIP